MCPADPLYAWRAVARAEVLGADKADSQAHGRARLGAALRPALGRPGQGHSGLGGERPGGVIHFWARLRHRVPSKARPRPGLQSAPGTFSFSGMERRKGPKVLSSLSLTQLRGEDHVQYVHRGCMPQKKRERAYWCGIKEAERRDPAARSARSMISSVTVFTYKRVTYRQMGEGGGRSVHASGTRTTVRKRFSCPGSGAGWVYLW